MNYIATYCGSSSGNKDIYRSDAKLYAQELHRNGLGLVYGGGNVGIMGIIADELIRLGGDIIGVIPKKLVEYEVAHTGIDKIHIVDTMHQRKALMCEYASGFAILPGAVGTLEELFEIVVLNQLQYINKPIAFLNTNNFYDKLFEFLHHLLEEGFLKKETFDSLYISESPERVVEYLKSKI